MFKRLFNTIRWSCSCTVFGKTLTEVSENTQTEGIIPVTVVGFSLRTQPLDKTDSKLSLVRIIIRILSQRS